MFKASLFGAVAGFIYAASVNLLSPFCTLCVTPLLGIGVGYLTSRFEQPDTTNAAVARAVMAGSVTSVAVVLGQILATVVNGVLITSLEQWPMMMAQVGLPQIARDDYWQTILTTNALCGVFNVFIICSLAAVGAIIWYRQHHPQGETHG